MSKSIHVCQSRSKPKVGRFLRHGVVKKVFVRTHTDVRTNISKYTYPHTGLIALPGPLKWARLV